VALCGFGTVYKLVTYLLIYLDNWKSASPALLPKIIPCSFLILRHKNWTACRDQNNVSHYSEVISISRISDSFNKVINSYKLQPTLQQWYNFQYIQGGPKKTVHGFHCNNFVYSQPIFTILAYIHCRKFATEGYS